MKILITAGPTREPIDPVRFITNRSTGKMGYALAAAAVEKGFETVLVSGPVNLVPPSGLTRFISVERAAEMAEAVKREAGSADFVIMCAAVADYTPAVPKDRKMKKSGEPMTLELLPTEDILAWLGRNKRAGQLLIGFAAETDRVEEYARGKIERKNLDWIAANQVGRPGRGFESDTNEILLISKNGKRVFLPLETKEAIAGKIIETVTENLP